MDYENTLFPIEYENNLPHLPKKYTIIRDYNFFGELNVFKEIFLDTGELYALMLGWFVRTICNNHDSLVGPN